MRPASLAGWCRQEGMKQEAAQAQAAQDRLRQERLSWEAADRQTRSALSSSKQEYAQLQSTATSLHANIARLNTALEVSQTICGCLCKWNGKAIVGSRTGVGVRSAHDSIKQGWAPAQEQKQHA